VPDPSPDDLEALLELQATDHRVRKVQHLLDDLPEQQRYEAAVSRVEELGREHDDVRVDLERAAAEQRQLERETDVLTERRDAETVRLYDGSVTNAREAKSVEAEIETTKRRIAEHEDSLLEVLETVEGLESRLAELARAQEASRQEAEEASTARDDSAKGLWPSSASSRWSATGRRRPCPTTCCAGTRRRPRERAGPGSAGSTATRARPAGSSSPTPTWGSCWQAHRWPAARSAAGCW
jgi:DNA repair exonuclease SbcCD ATPase subunit